MSTAPPEDDPLAQLEEWAREVEKRVTREKWVRPRRRVGAWSRTATRGLAIAAMIAVLVAGGWWLATDDHATTGGYPKEAVPSGVTATAGSPGSGASGSPLAGTPFAGTPFAGTPAAGWASGADGIATPPIAPEGAFSAAAVRADLDRVRSALIDGHLDTRMLVGHDSSAFLKLLSPGSRASIDAAIDAGRLRTTAIRLLQGTNLAVAQPRVRGRTTYRAITPDGVATLEVVTNYVWVYAFDGIPGYSGAKVVILHSEEHWWFRDSPQTDPADRGMSLHEWSGYASDVDCGWFERGFVDPPYGNLPALPDPTATANPPDLYQPDHSMQVTYTCEEVMPSANPGP